MYYCSDVCAQHSSKRSAVVWLDTDDHHVQIGWRDRAVDPNLSVSIRKLQSAVKRANYDRCFSLHLTHAARMNTRPSVVSYWLYYKIISRTIMTYVVIMIINNNFEIYIVWYLGKEHWTSVNTQRIQINNILSVRVIDSFYFSFNIQSWTSRGMWYRFCDLYHGKWTATQCTYHILKFYRRNNVDCIVCVAMELKSLSWLLLRILNKSFQTQTKPVPNKV